MLLGLPATLQSLIFNLLWSTTPTDTNSVPITFQLRHQHAITNTSRIIFSDFKPVVSFSESETQFSVHSQNAKVPRPQSPSSLNGHSLGWQDWEIPTPDVTKRSTLLQMGNMAFNTYAADNSTASEWYDISDKWRSNPYGWEPQADGMRGHVFASTDNSTVVIAIKGTSAGWMVGGGGPTVGKDKKNDNLLFSCCCARVGPTWSTVCDCYDGNYRCDTDCVEEAMKDEGMFYSAGLNLYNNVTYMYPNANIWLTGHSLGGGLAALMGTTFGAPVVAFEAPAERLASQRLHLPRPPSTNHITHVYNNADPIPMGTCTGVTSLCAIGGFALETRCHVGQVILYDTVQKLNWSVDIRNHGIKLVIDKILSDDAEWKDEYNGEQEDTSNGWFSMLHWGWKKRHSEEPTPDDGKVYREVPIARPAIEVEGVDGICTDCYSWQFGNFKNRTAKSAQCN